MAEIYFDFCTHPHYNRINDLSLYDEIKKGYYDLPYCYYDEVVESLPIRFGRLNGYHTDEDNIEGVEYYKDGDGYYKIRILFRTGDILIIDADQNYYPDKHDLNSTFEERVEEFKGDQEELFN